MKASTLLAYVLFLCVLCLLVIESFFKKSKWEIAWSWLICSPFHTQTIVWVCFPRDTVIMSWAPSPKSPACTKGTVHLGKSLLDFHLTPELFGFVWTSMQIVPVPKEQPNKREERSRFGCGLSVFLWAPSAPKGTSLRAPVVFVGDRRALNFSPFGAAERRLNSQTRSSWIWPFVPVSTETHHSKAVVSTSLSVSTPWEFHLDLCDACLCCLMSNFFSHL